MRGAKMISRYEKLMLLPKEHLARKIERYEEFIDEYTFKGDSMRIGEEQLENDILKIDKEVIQ